MDVVGINDKNVVLNIELKILRIFLVEVESVYEWELLLVDMEKKVFVVEVNVLKEVFFVLEYEVYKLKVLYVRM